MESFIILCEGIYIGDNVHDIIAMYVVSVFLIVWCIEWDILQSSGACDRMADCC